MKGFILWCIYLVFFARVLSNTSRGISDKRLCADPDCRTLLSLARTVINYQAAEEGILSFPINKDVRVYSKSAGSNPKLWGVEIQGQRGYVNKGWLREYRVLIKPADIRYEVPTERKYTIKHLENNSSVSKPTRNITAFGKPLKLARFVDLVVGHEEPAMQFPETNLNPFNLYNQSQLKSFDLNEEEEVLLENSNEEADYKRLKKGPLQIKSSLNLALFSKEANESTLDSKGKLIFPNTASTSTDYVTGSVKFPGLVKVNKVCKSYFYDLLQIYALTQCPLLELKDNPKGFQHGMFKSAGNSRLLATKTTDEYKDTIQSTSFLELNDGIYHGNKHCTRNPLLRYQELMCFKFGKQSGTNCAGSVVGFTTMPRSSFKYKKREKNSLTRSGIHPFSAKQQGFRRNILRILCNLLPAHCCQGIIGFTPIKSSLFNGFPDKNGNQSSFCHHLKGSMHLPLCAEQNSQIQYACDQGVSTFALLGIDHRVDLIIYLCYAAFSVIIFTIALYCLRNQKRVNLVFSKLNKVERGLLTSYKETDVLHSELKNTLNKLSSIENNSFGTNDMIILLRKELELKELENDQLREHTSSLEKELENAAEAGLELNRIVAELLNNHLGNDSIVNSVDELQKQLNEQQQTILDINSILAEKSRENSELQILLSDLNAKYKKELQLLTDQNEDLNKENNSMRFNICEMKNSFEKDLADIRRAKSVEIERLNQELTLQCSQLQDFHEKYKCSEARVKALEETIHKISQDNNYEIHDVFDAVDIQAKYLAIKTERDILNGKLANETEAYKLLETQNNIAKQELFILKEEYAKSEKEKLEAVTRFDVLSNYFKGKEAQLQNELSNRKSKWMEEQGEGIGTAEKLTFLQNEVQVLRSHNDSLRAEMEAQVAAHKIQNTYLENRAHESWLAARYADRKLEEARNEAAALRRKITYSFGNSTENYNIPSDIQNSATLQEFSGKNRYVSPPLSIEGNVSPSLNGIHAAFIPTPFIRPPLFLGLSPPQMPPGDLRPPPIGRLMSPPPPLSCNIRSPFSEERFPGSSVFLNNCQQFSTKYESETDVTPPLSPRRKPNDVGRSIFSSQEAIFELGNEGSNQLQCGESINYNIESSSKTTTKGSRGNCDTDSDKNITPDW